MHHGYDDDNGQHEIKWAGEILVIRVEQCGEHRHFLSKCKNRPGFWVHIFFN